jgi:hypothetical protein
VDGDSSPIYGILAEGGSPLLADDTVLGIQTSNGLQGSGTSVWIGNPNAFDDPDAVDSVKATVQGLRVNGYNKRGINVAGLGAAVPIEGNAVTGPGYAVNSPHVSVLQWAAIGGTPPTEPSRRLSKAGLAATNGSAFNDVGLPKFRLREADCRHRAQYSCFARLVARLMVEMPLLRGISAIWARFA